MLTLELPLLFLLILFRMVNLNWNTGGFDHNSDIKHNVAMGKLTRAQAGLNPVAEWKVGIELLVGAKAQRCSSRYFTASAARRFMDMRAT